MLPLLQCHDWSQGWEGSRGMNATLMLLFWFLWFALIAITGTSRNCYLAKYCTVELLNNGPLWPFLVKWTLPQRPLIIAINPNKPTQLFVFVCSTAVCLAVLGSLSIRSSWTIVLQCINSNYVWMSGFQL